MWQIASRVANCSIELLTMNLFSPKRHALYWYDKYARPWNLYTVTESFIWIWNLKTYCVWHAKATESKLSILVWHDAMIQIKSCRYILICHVFPSSLFLFSHSFSVLHLLFVRMLRLFVICHFYLLLQMSRHRFIRFVLAVVVVVVESSCCCVAYEWNWMIFFLCFCFVFIKSELLMKRYYLVHRNSLHPRLWTLIASHLAQICGVLALFAMSCTLRSTNRIIIHFSNENESLYLHLLSFSMFLFPTIVWLQLDYRGYLHLWVQQTLKLWQMSPLANMTLTTKHFQKYPKTRWTSLQNCWPKIWSKRLVAMHFSICSQLNYSNAHFLLFFFVVVVQTVSVWKRIRR